MPYKIRQQCIDDAFELFLKYNGERFDLIEKEMRLKGWSKFSKQSLSNRGKGSNFREGWIERFGWNKSLEKYIEAKYKSTLSNAEKLLFEIETIREKLFTQLQSSGVNNRDLVYQHEKYSQRCAELLAQIEKANNPLSNFASFFKFLISSSLAISPTLARELVNAEDAIIKLAKNEFGNKK